MSNRKKIGVMCLTVGTFLNPLGYAEAIAGTMELTGWDYWTTTHLFYVLAFLLLSASFYLLKINPITFARENIGKLIKLFRRKS